MFALPHLELEMLLEVGIGLLIELFLIVFELGQKVER